MFSVAMVSSKALVQLRGMLSHLYILKVSYVIIFNELSRYQRLTFNIGPMVGDDVYVEWLLENVQVKVLVCLLCWSRLIP